MLGAALLCFSAITFVAANWSEPSKGLRLVLLFSALWAAYGTGWAFDRAGHAALAQAAPLAGIGSFGAPIILVAQTYHLDGHAPDAVLLWALGAVATRVLARSNPGLCLALLLVTLWSCWQRVEL